MGKRWYGDIVGITDDTKQHVIDVLDAMGYTQYRSKLPMSATSCIRIYGDGDWQFVRTPHPMYGQIYGQIDITML